MKSEGYGLPHSSVIDKMDSDRVFLYSQKGNILLDANKMHSQAFRRIEKFKENYPDWVDLKEDESVRVKIYDFCWKKEEQALKSSERNKFVNSVTKHINDYMLAIKFLNGATEGGGRAGLNIQDNVLCYYSNPTILRLNEEEFVMGAALSGVGKNNPAALSRITSALLLANAKFWPSSYISWGDRDHFKEEPEFFVFEYIENMLMVCQIKWPTARTANRLIYKELYYNTVKLYKEAIERWGNRLCNTDVENMIKIFGNKKEMKEYNKSLRMIYELQR